MLSLGSYLLGAVQVALVVLSLGFASYRMRQRLLPTWEGAPARLVESIVGIALLIWISELLGVLGLFYAGALVAVSVLIAAAVAFWSGGPVATGDPPARKSAPQAPWMLLVMAGVIAVVVFHWGITTKHALDRGVFNFDSLWYHLPFAADMVQSHSLTGMHHVETVFTNWFYPQNSEVMHAVGMLLTGRDTLSLFVNFGWLAIAFLAAWCVGRPYGRGPLAVVAAAILLDCHTLVVRDPGAAKNDLAAAALVLAAIAILVTAWNARGSSNAVVPGMRGQLRSEGWVGWPLAAAGVATGLAVGTRVTALAMAAALTVAVVVLSPAGRRWAAAAWWFLPAFAAGGFWYLRNLVVAGNPIPEIEKLGPISLPHPEQVQEGRPDFDIVHYATDTSVWREYFAPGLNDAFGVLWPLVVFGALAAALLAIVGGRDRIVRWVGAVALFGAVAYLFTPLSAAGAEGEPVGFGINIRYVVPALLGGIVLLPLPRFLDAPRRQWALLGVLVLVFLVTDRPEEALRDPARIFSLLLVALAVAVPAALLLARGRGASRGIVAGGFAALALALLAIGYPLQRNYLDTRFANDGAADKQIPGMDLDSAYRWARGIEDARIGLAGTTAGFAGYGFYGTDLSNRVVYLGEETSSGGFNPIPDCRAFRAAVDAADLDYLVTAPFLNFLHPSDPIPSPEARWLRGEEAVEPLLRSGPVTVWEVRGQLDPDGCGAPNAPLHEVPNTPGA